MSKRMLEGFPHIICSFDNFVIFFMFHFPTLYSRYSVAWRRLKRRKAVKTSDKEGFSDGTQGSFLSLRDARNQIWGKGAQINH